MNGEHPGGAPDLRHLSEAEWLKAWQQTLAQLEQTRRALLDSEMELTGVQVAHLTGSVAMLREVLTSRGIDVGEVGDDHAALVAAESHEGRVGEDDGGYRMGFPSRRPSHGVHRGSSMRSGHDA